MSKTVTAAEDWLSFALAELDEEKIAANVSRAETAMNVRVEQRFAKFVHNAADQDELKARLDAVDEAVKATAEQVGVEYGVDPLSLYESAKKKLSVPYDNNPYSGDEYGQEIPGANEPAAGEVPPEILRIAEQYLREHPEATREEALRVAEQGIAGWSGAPNVGGEGGAKGIPGWSGAPRTWASVKDAAGVEMPEGQAYDYKRVDPDSTIGDTPASSSGQNFQYDRDVDDTLGQSKDHPRELQSVEQHVEDRRDLQDTDAGLEAIQRKVETINPDETIGDNKGAGGTFPRGNQAQPITSKFYLLD